MSYPLVIITTMELGLLDEATELVEKANANLKPELVAGADARVVLAKYARLKKLVSYGEAMMARRVDDASAVAHATGTSMGQAKKTVETGAALEQTPEIGVALATGEISVDQAGEIAKAEQARPGSASDLLSVAHSESFQVLRDQARKVELDAAQSRGLGERQRKARSARSFCDDLGMVTIHLRLQPHVGTSIVNRAEAKAARLFRAAKKEGRQEPFERHLADAYAGMRAPWRVVPPRGPPGAPSWSCW